VCCVYFFISLFFFFFTFFSDPKVAPSLQSTADHLQHQQTANKLDKKIETRANQKDLVEHNILKGMFGCLFYVCLSCVCGCLFRLLKYKSTSSK
jgi:hypothetical protein